MVQLGQTPDSRALLLSLVHLPNVAQPDRNKNSPSTSSDPSISPQSGHSSLQQVRLWAAYISSPTSLCRRKPSPHFSPGGGTVFPLDRDAGGERVMRNNHSKD